MNDVPAPEVNRREELLAEMEDWVAGRRSYVNLGPNEPYTPDVIAAMDAQEVVKLAAAANAYITSRNVH